MAEIRFDNYDKPKRKDKMTYPEELLDKKCGGCNRCKLREYRRRKRGTHIDSLGYHCTMQKYDKDIFPTDKACVHYWDKAEEENYQKACNEAEENRRKELWVIYSQKEPIKLPIVNDGYGMIPMCPVCGEMPYSTEQCHWCGQRFIQDKEVEEYSKPLTKEMNCMSCGKKVIANVSKYNGHIHYSCECGCNIMS